MGPFNLHAYNYPLKYFTKIVSYFKKCGEVQAKTLYVRFAHDSNALYLNLEESMFQFCNFVQLHFNVVKNTTINYTSN